MKNLVDKMMLYFSTVKVEVRLKERIEILRRENSFEQGSKIRKGGVKLEKLIRKLNR